MRQDVFVSETESFGYDFLGRLTAVSVAYNESYTYNQIGNIISKNGVSYTYGSSRPRAVTAVGTTNYSYDANGNMISRGNQTITWDLENRPVSITDGVNTTTFVYDGDGKRVKKTEGGQTVVYIGKYYEKNLTTGNVTTYYYLGDRLVALRNGTDLRYIHEDHLTGTSVVSDASGSMVGSIKYFPYGSTRGSSGSLYTDKKFTGQRLDATGLYYYGARYYDPTIGRFISPDTVGPSPLNPQSYNRYSYCFNNPLAFIDPTGNWGWSNITKWVKDNVVTPIEETAVDIGKAVSANIDTVQTMLDFAGMIPVIGEPVDALNGFIYAARGDELNAGLSFAACVPVAGMAATVGKLVNKGDNVVNATKGVLKASDKLGEAKGFDSYKKLKNSLGSPGKGNRWHHIVEQSQINKSGFDPKMIHNPDNVVAINKATHYKISGYYSSIDKQFSDTMRVRDWLARQPFDFQYQFGLDTLRRFGY